MVIEITMNPGEEHKAFDALRAVAEKLAHLDSRIQKSMMHMDELCHVESMPADSQAILQELDTYLDWA